MATGTRLKGCSALITGGAQGIGKAIAQAFAGEGASVCVVDVNGDAAEETASGLRGNGVDAFGQSAFAAKPHHSIRISTNGIDVVMRQSILCREINKSCSIITRNPTFRPKPHHPVCGTGDGSHAIVCQSIVGCKRAVTLAIITRYTIVGCKPHDPLCIPMNR